MSALDLMVFVYKCIRYNVPPANVISVINDDTMGCVSNISASSRTGQWTEDIRIFTFTVFTITVLAFHVCTWTVFSTKGWSWTVALPRPVLRYE